MIKIAIAGVGNCAAALLYGLQHYRDDASGAGLLSREILGWRVNDIEICLAFDIDARKIGRPVHEACQAPPNKTSALLGTPRPFPVTVEMGPVLDGCAPHLADHPEDQRIVLSDAKPVDVANRLKESGAEILVCLLPVGSEFAARAYAEACLKAKVALLNCIPTFIASDEEWVRRFENAGLPLLGDDIKSQLGATILHRALAELCASRGTGVTETYQLNVGGNLDFLNMTAEGRLQSKRRSKTQAVQSALALPLPEAQIRIGPSDYVQHLGDRKICYINLKALGFMDIPIEIDLKLAVIDSPNAAAIIVEGIRYLKIALENGLRGTLDAACAVLMKSPPTQMNEAHAKQMLTSQLATLSPRV
jgi:myo-inositol-1-phosphate synthase